MSMHQVLVDLSVEISRVLEKVLPTTGNDWWQSAVIDRLSIQQQRLVTTRQVTNISGLDLAALLRVFDQNWNSLGYRLNLDQSVQATLDRAQAERDRVLYELKPKRKEMQVIQQEEQPLSDISKGTVVRLRARPDITGAVLDVLPGEPEARYTVFHGGEVATYYESQVEPIVLKPVRNSVEPEGHTTGARAGPTGGKAWGTNARTGSPRVVEIK